MKALGCMWRGWHDAAPQPMGGWRCRDCSTPGMDLAEAGTLRTGGYVSPVRRVYDRESGTVTRTSAWERSERGGSW